MSIAASPKPCVPQPWFSLEPASDIFGLGRLWSVSLLQHFEFCRGCLTCSNPQSARRPRRPRAAQVAALLQQASPSPCPQGHGQVAGLLNTTGTSFKARAHPVCIRTEQKGPLRSDTGFERHKQPGGGSLDSIMAVRVCSPLSLHQEMLAG